MTLPIVAGLVAALVLPQTLPSNAPLSPASPPAATVPTPIGTASPAPLFSAAPLVPGTTATPDPASYGYRFVPAQPKTLTPGQPQIFAVYLNAMHLKSHGPIIIRVETSANVVKMESKSNGRGGAIPMVAPGVFFATSKLPGIPFIAAGITTDLLFIGTGPDGRTVTVKVPVRLG